MVDGHIVWLVQDIALKSLSLSLSLLWAFDKEPTNQTD